MAGASNKRRASHLRGSHTSKTAKGGALSINGGAHVSKTPRKLTLISSPGRFGPWGGRYVPETLMAALDELEREYERAKKRSEVQSPA